MRTLVTAILVARSGGEWLDQTLEALRQQTHRPDRFVTVVSSGGAPEQVMMALVDGGAQQVVTSNGALSFGEAVRRAAAAVPETPTAQNGEPVQEWFWLLSEDSAPDPDALERILETVQRAPSVALAAPKLVDWDRPEHIVELGQSLTKRGSRWLLRRQELDQQQYDHLQDVLGVGPVGLLVRRDVWRQLDGFDPAYAVYDDGLDLSVRARLAGYRVVVAPESRIRVARTGVAGPRVDRSRRVARATHRQGRVSHLHRRIAYAPAFAAFFMWLGLPLVAIARVFWALIREHPGRMLGEFTSALYVFFTPGSILASRRRIREITTAGWAAVNPLRIDPKTVRTTRMIDREAILAAQGRQTRELHFISSGGLAVLVTSFVVSIALTWWAIPHLSLTGGALAPLSSLGELWRSTITQGGVPADPFAWVLAVIGTIGFWNPSHAVVLLLILAVPAAALGGWVWAAQLTESKAGRALVGLAWSLSPVMLMSLAGGRLPTIILAVTLPWLMLAATRCRESWSWAGTTSLLAAIVLACAPVLIPAAFVLFLVGLLSSLHGITRVLTTAIAPIVVFAPKLFAMIGGSPFDLAIDPGITPAFIPGSPWHLMLGFPEFGLAGWAGILDAIGLGGPPATLLVGVLLVLVVLLAALGLFTGRVLVTLLNALFAGLGLVTALGSAQLHLVSEGSETVAVWTGSGLAMYWIGVLGLAAVGCTVLRRAATPLVSVAVLLALVAVAPVGVKLVTNQTGIVSGDQQLPAIVQAAGAADPTMRTLILSAQENDGVRAELVTGASLRLDQLRTASREPQANEQDQWVGELVGMLASTGDDEASAQALGEHGVGFVILRPGGNDEVHARLQGALDQNAELSNAGQSGDSLLWRLTGSAVEDADAQSVASTSSSLEGSTLSGQAIWVIQLVVLAGMLLLALPTGEVVERPERRRKRRRVLNDGPETDRQAEAAAETESNTENEPEPAPELEPEPETDPEAGIEPQPESESESESEPAAAPEPEPETEPDAESQADTPDDAPAEQQEEGR